MSRTFKVKRPITLPQLKLVEEQPIYVRMESMIYQGKEVPDSDMDAPLLVKVTNLETGELQEVVVGSVLNSVLTEDMEDSYEGLCFMITMHTKADGKRYRTYTIAEIEDPDNDQTEA